MKPMRPKEPANEHAGDVGNAGMSRRGVIRAAGAGALALGLGGATLTAAAAPAAASQKGTGSVPQPPHQRGTGLRGKPADGYDTGTLADDLGALMDAVGHQQFAVVGHDTGMPNSYALTADHRDRVDRLAVAEAVLPDVTPSPPPFLPTLLNEPLFYLTFNKLPTMNEQLVQGREDIYFGYEFAIHAGTKQLPGYAVRYYINNLAADPGALRGSFGWYCALDTTTAQNQQRSTQKLTLPVLAIGAESLSTGPAER